MDQQTAPLDDILQRFGRLDRTITGDDLYGAMESAVILDPSYPGFSEYKGVSPQERCTMLLQGYRNFLHQKDDADPVGAAYMNLAVVVGHSSGTFSSTWKPVLEKYRTERGLEKPTWVR